MKCLKCKKELSQIGALWTPKTPNQSYRYYVCNDCGVKYTEVVDVDSCKVRDVEKTSLSSERQSTLMEW